MLWTDLEPGDVIRFKKIRNLKYVLGVEDNNCDCDWCKKQRKCLKKERLVVKSINIASEELILDDETIFYMDDETFKATIDILELVDK